MKPIAKVMAAALSAAALIAATSATAGARKDRKTPPATSERQILAPQADGFVIRASMPGTAGSTAPSPLPPRFIPIGADIRLDARLLAPGQTK